MRPPQAPVWDEEPPYHRPRRDHSGNGFLVGSVLVLLLLTGGFVAWRLFGMPSVASNDRATEAAKTPTNAAVAGFVPISPPDMLQTVSTIMALSGPNPTDRRVGEIPAGTMVDVVGTTGGEAAGWAQIIMPLQQTQRAWVPRAALRRLQNAPIPQPLDPMTAVPTDPQASTEPQPSGLSDLPTFVGYVTRGSVNVRNLPSTQGQIVTRLRRGQAVSINGAMAGNDGVWYRIETENGGAEWIKADLISRERPTTDESSERSEPSPADSAENEPRRNPAVEPGEPSDSKPPPPTPGTSTNDRRDEAQPTRRSSQGLVVSAPQANLREGPAIEEGNVVSSLKQGTRLTVLQSRTTQGRVWYQVRTPSGTIGWVSSATVTAND